MTSRRGRGHGAAVAPARLEAMDGFDVLVTRKRVKNLSIRVRPDGTVEASVPARMPMSEVRSFVGKKAGWVRAQQRRLADGPQARAERATAEEQARWKALVSAFVPPLLEKWEPVLGVRAKKVAYRNMKSRWGSCQPSTGRLCFNTRLALYPPECLEYVVVHELCHLLVPGHGKDFWALVSRCLPDYRRAYDLLKR